MSKNKAIRHSAVNITNGLQTDLANLKRSLWRSFNRGEIDLNIPLSNREGARTQWQTLEHIETRIKDLMQVITQID